MAVIQEWKDECEEAFLAVLIRALTIGAYDPSNPPNLYEAHMLLPWMLTIHKKDLTVKRLLKVLNDRP